jgi:hypothetical protein
MNEEYLEKKVASLQEHCQKLEVINADLQDRIVLMEMQKKQWEAEKVKQQQIFQLMLDNKNKEHNEILEENERLRGQLRKLKNGN